MTFFKLHRSNLVYIAICTASIAAFFLVGIYPNSRSMDQLEESIVDLSAKVKDQELLYPVYQELIKQVQQKIPKELPVPAQKKISRDALGNINGVFMEIAKQSQVTFENAVPDPSSYLEEGGLLTINVRFSGDFFHFRELIFDLCRLPYLDSIDQMQIESVDNMKRIALKLRLIQG
jgi:hypothetical protein